MKKALISAAAAAALLGAAGVAQAQVTAYGLFDISVGKSVTGDSTGNDVGLHSGGDGGASEGNSTTRFGIKGSVDVGSGIKANFNYQAGITGAGATNGKTTGTDGDSKDDNLQLFNRQAWGGLSGGFGEFRFGQQDSVPFQTFIGLDYNGASNGVSAAYFAGSEWLQLSRQSNSLQYISPAMGGLTVQVGYTMDSAANDYKSATDDNEDKKNVVSAGATYVAGPLTLAAAFQGQSTKDDDKSTKDFDETAPYMGFGAQYDFGAFKLKADYHKVDTRSSINAGVVTTVAGGWSLGAQYSIGNDKSRVSNTTDDVKTTAYELFVNKEVLKNVYGYAEIGGAKTDADTLWFGDDSDSATGFAVGMILVF
ncbi:porin [Hylemonella gracilis]|uniref:Outer membrane protein (Porin) n=1 Tax=Hylemonella gracilis ATCC 19624 TaxID=887062 RepID=F3KS97_9BURK|nr:porin [Hylemonella gracilis]EGI77291.1 outer membrane protein (porin) [Hylemonella gracilis ATCC 19624]